jgi:hypothetical protein
MVTRRFRDYLPLQHLLIILLLSFVLKLFFRNFNPSSSIHDRKPFLSVHDGRIKEEKQACNSAIASDVPSERSQPFPFPSDAKIESGGVGHVGPSDAESIQHLQAQPALRAGSELEMIPEGVTKLKTAQGTNAPKETISVSSLQTDDSTSIRSRQETECIEEWGQFKGQGYGNGFVGHRSRASSQNGPTANSVSTDIGTLPENYAGNEEALTIENGWTDIEWFNLERTHDLYPPDEKGGEPTAEQVAEQFLETYNNAPYRRKVEMEGKKGKVFYLEDVTLRVRALRQTRKHESDKRQSVD